jgi:isopenicillin N synthase-like dioxygenase
MDLSKANIPVIDISPSNPNAPEELLSAASKYGFVFIKNSPEIGGISPQDIAKMFELSKEFFAAPFQVKEEVSIASNKAGKNQGWLSQGIEKLDPKTQKRADVKEYVEYITHLSSMIYSFVHK